MAKITASKCRTLFTRFINDSLPRVSDSLFFDFLNDINIDIYTYWQGINPYDLTSTQNYTLVSWTTSYTLPVDFQSINGRWLWLFKLSDTWVLWEQYIETNPWSSANWFYIWTSIQVTWSLSWSAQLRYFPVLTIIDDNTDMLIIDDDARFYSPLRNLINMLYQGWKNNNYEEIRSWNKYLQDIKNLWLSLRKSSHWISLDSTYL